MSVATDQLMIITLVSVREKMPAVATSFDSRMDLTMKQIVQGKVHCRCVNGVREALCALRDKSKNALPAMEDCPWLNG